MSSEAKLPEPVGRRRHRNRQAEGKTGDGGLAVPAEVARDRQVSRIADLALSQCDTGRAWTKPRGLSSPQSTPCQSGLLRQLINRAPGPRARSLAEARHLDGHPALFPDAVVTWAEDSAAPPNSRSWPITSRSSTACRPRHRPTPMPSPRERPSFLADLVEPAG